MYRFRLVTDLDALPAEGGNFAYVRGSGSATEIIYCGVADTLHEAVKRWDEAKAQHHAEAVYVRLNITRALREREHVDLLSKLEPLLA